MTGTRDGRAALAAAQGAYYLVTGLWPLVHMRSFLRVTGPKRDLWLVRTVGALAIAIGAPLVTAALRGRTRSDTRLLGKASALAFAASDTVHAAAGIISPIYLVDAAIELAFAQRWMAREG